MPPVVCLSFFIFSLFQQEGMQPRKNLPKSRTFVPSNSEDPEVGHLSFSQLDEINQLLKENPKGTSHLNLI
jgi:hypothetical protein